MIKRISLFLLGSLLGLVTLIVIIALWYINLFSRTSGLAISDIRSIYSQSQMVAVPDQLTILLLGLDQRDDSLESTLLTDAIIIAQIDISKNTITLTPIPRDLWIDTLKTKINALYFYGQERESTTGVQFVSEELTRITGVTIDHYLVLNYQNMDELIDILGGVTIDVPADFTDTEFPNADYLSDPSAPIYQTVQFDQGVEHMDGDRALTYIRSRSSDDVSEGTDLARSSRQLHVFNALVAQVSSRSFILNPHRVGQAYRFWDEQIDTSLSMPETLALARSLNPQTISIQSRSIPASFITNDQLLYNPPVEQFGLWVWAPRDPNWGELRAFFAR